MYNIATHSCGKGDTLEESKLSNMKAKTEFDKNNVLIFNLNLVESYVKDTIGSG